MKKIALLFTILCAGALNGMEVPEYGHFVGLGTLPPEIKATIIMFLNEYDNLNDIVNAIRATSLTNRELNKIVNEMYGNQKGFTALVHMLADKFGKETISVAYAFKTPASKVYLTLGTQLLRAIGEKDINKTAQLIAEGADINVKTGATPLIKAVWIGIGGKSDPDMLKIITLLLNSGANPNIKDHNGFTALELAQRKVYDRKDNAEQIRALLKEAMKKQQK